MNPAATLALKLVLTPLLVGSASLAGRRWGSAVGGWLIGIPFTSGPIALFLALDRGPGFAADAAAGIMLGAISQASFCIAYAWVAGRARWPAALGAATLAYAAATLVLDAAVVPVTRSFVVILVALVVALFLMPAREPRPTDRARQAALPWWDLPARMVVATMFVLGLTAAAPSLGARLAGLLAPFPLYGAVLAVFAHQVEGAHAAIAVVGGLLLGLFAFTSFFFIVGLLLFHCLALAFAAAAAVALGVQACTLVAGRRLGLA